QQAEEGARQIRRLPAHLIGGGVTSVEEIPVRLAHPPAIAPLEVDALPRHLLALLAQLLALARTQAVEEILKIAVAPVEPVELATQALQPAGTPGEQRVIIRLGEVHMPAGQLPLRQLRFPRL